MFLILSVKNRKRPDQPSWPEKCCRSSLWLEDDVKDDVKATVASVYTVDRTGAANASLLVFDAMATS